MSALRWIATIFLLLLAGENAWASFASVELSKESVARRDLLTARLTAGASRPTLTLMGPKTLKVVFPRTLSLPVPDNFKEKTQFIDSMRVDEIREDQVGLYLTLEFNEPYLHLKDTFDESDPENPVFQLLIERYAVSSAIGPTRIFEGRAFAGRDATLFLISFTGHGWVEKDLDFGLGVLRLNWPEAKFEEGWADVAPEGLVNSVHAYGYAKGGVEMELKLHPQAEQVFFHRSAEAGLLVVEIKRKRDLGRGEEITRIIEERRQANQNGSSQPLNRFTPIFINGPDKATLVKQEVDEAYFFDKALEAERERKYGKARAYLDSLLQVFPKSANRELVEFKQLDLAVTMGWEPGWILNELEGLLSAHPNTVFYPGYRLLQLRMLNDSEQYENALAVLQDPNLPKNSSETAIERARAAIGLGRWNEARIALEEALRLDPKDGDPSAMAHFLQARTERLSGTPKKAAAMLDAMSDEHHGIIANRPKLLMEVADTYFQNGRYDKALHHYAQFLNYYPVNEELSPVALLQAGESRRHLGDTDSAINLYNRLLIQFPDSPSALWARVYTLQLQEERPVADRLKDLEEIISITPVTGAVVEAYFQKAVLQAREVSKRSAIETMNRLLALNDREKVRIRASNLKRIFLEEGMAEALREGRPEYAIILGELYGVNWSRDPTFSKSRILLSEAVARLGGHQKAMDLLQGIVEWPAPELTHLSESLSQGDYLSATGKVEREYPGLARIRLDEAARLAVKKEWEAVLILLERLPDQFLREEERSQRLRLLAQAEQGRGRFPQAVANLEKLLFEKPVGNGVDHFWYATLLQLWKGDLKSKTAYDKVVKEADHAEVKAFARMRLADIAQQTGDWQEAQTHYKEAAKLVPGTLMATLARENSRQLEMGR